MRGAGRWLASMALAIALVAGVFWLAWHGSLDLASKLSEVASFALALAVVLTPVALKAFRWPSLKLITDEEIEADAADLAAGLRTEWDREKSLPRREGDAITSMRLRWEMPTSRGDLHGSFGEILLAFSLSSSRRLVILGESGGGKSTLALELARRLVESRTPGDQVPVVLHVARWHPGQKLADWVAGQLAQNHPGLARRGRSESGNLVTRAQALVAGVKVIPVLDGLDEVAAPLRAAAIAEINRYGADKPLVVACRTGAYRDAVHGNGGRSVARAAELTLRDLRPAEIKDFLAAVPDERWSRLFGRLEAEPGGGLAHALGNPLMLSLCRAIYTGRSPDELADRYRFAHRAAIEDHLLGHFVHAAYAATSSPVDTGRFRCTGEQAQRWLSFLAGHSDQYYLPWEYRTASVTPPAPDLSWWHLYRAERGGWRILGPAVRSILRITIIAALAVWILAQRGNWRNGWYHGPVRFGSLLDGPLGRLARPVADRLLPPHSAALVITGIAVSFVFMAELAHFVPLVPAWVTIKPFRTLRAVLGAAVILPLLAAGVMIWRLTQERHHLPVAAFIDSRSTLATLLAVALGSLLWLPRSLIVPTDRRGAVSPPESLRLDRQADLVVTLLWRSAVAVILLVWSGAQIALAYAIFAAAATLIALALGGRFSFGSRSYADACWSLGLSRHLPRQVMAFMADAESRGVLRATGTDYEFRHIRVQQQLHDSWGRSRWLNRDTRREKRRDLRERLTQREKSLVGLTQTVKEYRIIAGRSDSPAFGEFGPKLALSLTRLAGKLGALGRRDDEVDALSERTEVYRSLAERDPGTFCPQLAGSLGELAARLAAMERFSESLGTTRETVDIERELARADNGYQLDLAGSLSRLVWNLKPLAGHTGNLEAIEGTVECLREMEPGDATVRPWLAEALVHQAFTLRASERPGEYERVMAQALDVYSRLSEEKRYHDKKRSELEGAALMAGFPRPESDSAISDSVARVAGKGEVAEFIWNSFSKTVETYRHLAKTKSGAFLPDLKRALSRMSDSRTYSETWESDEYRAASREADRIWFIYLGSFDSSYLWGSAGPYCLLRDLAEPLWKAGEYQDALTVIEIAQGLGGKNYPSIDHEMWIRRWQRNYRTERWRMMLAEKGWSLAKGSPDWQKGYARSLGIIAGYMDDLAFELAVRGQKAEAKSRAEESAATYRQAADIYRELSSAQPATFLPDLARSLDALAAELRKTGSPEHKDEAEAATAEAAILRFSLGLSPDHSEPDT